MEFRQRFQEPGKSASAIVRPRQASRFRRAPSTEKTQVSPTLITVSGVIPEHGGVVA